MQIRKNLGIAMFMGFLGIALVSATRSSEHSSDNKKPRSLPEEKIAEINSRYLKDVKPIFQKSCFDCHSEFTVYPWYHKLPIVKGMMDDHIQDGRRHIDFSRDFPFSENPVSDLEEIREEIAEDKMPLLSYRLIHWGSALNKDEKKKVFGWIDWAISLINPDAQ